MGKIYLIESNQNGHVTYKIGKTNRSARARLEELSTGNAGQLKIVFEYETPTVHLLEGSLHRHFAHCHLHGEWFDDTLDMNEFVKACTIYDNALKSITQQ